MTRKLRRGKSKVYDYQTVSKGKGRDRPERERPRRGRNRPGRHEDSAHSEEHENWILVYTSPTAIATTASVPIYPPRGGMITAVHLNVHGTAPSGSALTCDVLIGGVSIFDSDLPSIAAGEYTSGTSGTGNLDDDPRHAGNTGLATFRAFEKVQIQCTAVSGAAGPLVVQLEIDWEQ